MDYKGISMDKLLKDKLFLDSLTKDAIISIFFSLLRILQDLHELEIVHVDLKPSNICLDYSPHVPIEA